MARKEDPVWASLESVGLVEGGSVLAGSTVPEVVHHILEVEHTARFWDRGTVAES